MSVTAVAESVSGPRSHDSGADVVVGGFDLAVLICRLFIPSYIITRFFFSTPPCSHTFHRFFFHALPALPPSVNLLHLLLQAPLQTAFRHLHFLQQQQRETDIFSLFDHLWSKTKQYLLTSPLYVSLRKRTCKYKWTSMGRGTKLSHIYNPTLPYMSSLLSLCLSLSLRRPVRQKGLLCKCTSE